MNSGLYAACAGLLARTQELELAANNLANINTSGYKSQSSSFHSLLATARGIAPNSLVQAVNDFGVLGDSRTDLTQGSLERTNNEFDFALQGKGFFEIQSTGGSRYTRAGNFHLDAQRRLVTAEGDLVLGATGPITLPPGTVSVSSDGTISVDGVLSGALRIVDFAPGTVLTPAGRSSFSAPANAARPAQGASVIQSSIESSNVNAISTAVSLIGLQRNADMLERALTTFHSDLNRIAAEDLSRL